MTQKRRSPDGATGKTSRRVSSVFVFYPSPLRGFIAPFTPSRGFASLHPCLWSTVPSGLLSPCTARVIMVAYLRHAPPAPDTSPTIPAADSRHLLHGWLPYLSLWDKFTFFNSSFAGWIPCISEFYNMNIRKNMHQSSHFHFSLFTFHPAVEMTGYPRNLGFWAFNYYF